MNLHAPSQTCLLMRAKTKLPDDAMVRWLSQLSGWLVRLFRRHGASSGDNGGHVFFCARALGIEWPIIQAPRAGAQGRGLAVAVSNAGGLGSLPCAMLSPDAIRSELSVITAATARPFNVTFFCHTPPQPDPDREHVWRALVRPYLR